MLAIYLARCVNPLNFATRDLIYSCYAFNSSNSCLQDERHRAAEFIAADPLNDGIPQTSQLVLLDSVRTDAPVETPRFLLRKRKGLTASDRPGRIEPVARMRVLTSTGCPCFLSGYSHRPQPDPYPVLPDKEHTGAHQEWPGGVLPE